MRAAMAPSASSSPSRGVEPAHLARRALVQRRGGAGEQRFGAVAAVLKGGERELRRRGLARLHEARDALRPAGQREFYPAAAEMTRRSESARISSDVLRPASPPVRKTRKTISASGNGRAVEVLPSSTAGALCCRKRAGSPRRRSRRRCRRYRRPCGRRGTCARPSRRGRACSRLSSMVLERERRKGLGGHAPVAHYLGAVVLHGYPVQPGGYVGRRARSIRGRRRRRIFRPRGRWRRRRRGSCRP